MKKFKIKNRQKRKYVKKTAANLNFSASRAALFGMAPFFFVAVVFFMTAMMSNQVFSQLAKLNFSITLPTISYEPITEPFTNIYKSISHAISDLSLPVFPQIAIPVPTIDFQKPLTQIEANTTMLLREIQHSTIAFTLFFSQSINNLLGLLDPRPLLPALLQSIATSFSLTFTSLSFLARASIAHSLFQLTVTSIVLHTTVHYSIITISLLYQGSSMLFTLIQQGIIQATNALVAFIELILKIATAVFEYVTNVTTMTITFIWQKIVSITHAIITLIETPFRIMGIYYKKAEPSIIYFLSLIKHAADEFTTTAAAIFHVPAEVAKQTPK